MRGCRYRHSPEQASTCYRITFKRNPWKRRKGQNKLGVTINLAAREGWLGVVKQHIAADPLWLCISEDG